MTTILAANSLAAWAQTDKSYDKSYSYDSDGDGIVDNCDLDSDNDGIPDLWENLNNNNQYQDDDREGDLNVFPTLGDLTPAFLDLDSDNDAIPDLFESGLPLSIINNCDPGHTGVLTGPVGANGLLDAVETFPDSGIPIYTLRDTDGDGAPDFVDLTSNGVDFDLYTIGYAALDEYGYGFVSIGFGSDDDGMMDVSDSSGATIVSADYDTASRGSANAPLSPLAIEYTPIASDSSVAAAADADCSITLPVGMSHFRLYSRQTYVVLEGTTVSELDIKGFFVERSSNGRNWNSIDFVAAAHLPAGTAYEYTDEYPLKGQSYYRLQQVDNNGRLVYSPVLIYNAKGVTQHIEIYPNPVQESLNIAGLQGGETIKIYDIVGRLAYQVTAGNSGITIPFERLSEGVYYILVVRENGEVSSHKVVKRD